MAFRPIQSVNRALDILEYLARSSGPVALKELHYRLGLQTTTAYNLVETLVARGYVRKTADPLGYAPGAALASVLSNRQDDAHLTRLESITPDLASEFPVGYTHVFCASSGCRRGSSADESRAARRDAEARSKAAFAIRQRFGDGSAGMVR